MSDPSVQNSAALVALGELSTFFGGRSEVENQVFKNSDGKIIKDEARRLVSQEVLPFITRSTVGGMTSQQIRETIQALGVDAKSLVAILDDNAGGDGVSVAGGVVTPSEVVQGYSAAQGSKTSTSLSAIQVFPIDLSFATRDSEILDVFFNGIPNIEFSRCVPFFDLLVISPGAPLDSNGRPTTMSQFSFLSPNEPLNDGLGKDLATGLPLGFTPPAGSEEGDQFTVSGMELFTSPQTLVNANDQYFEPDSSSAETPGSNPILDRFRPFMTIRSFTVNVQPAFGMDGFKTAKMSLVLHDRSRLSQIAPLVQPDLYGKTELRVEYGWSHPDANSLPGINPIGDFLNSLRQKEKYGIVNSSFSFSDAGEVDINLDLAMRGASNIFTANISDSPEITDIKEQLEGAIKTLQEQLKAFRGYDSSIPDVIGKTIIPAGSSTSSALKADKETREKIQAYINDPNNRGTELSTALKNIFGDGKSKSQGITGEAQSTAKQSFDNKLNYIKEATERQASAFGAQFTTPDSSTPTNRFATSAVTMTPGYTNLGQLMMNFVGTPLAATGNFDEVQFIFYSFNRLAGHVRNNNIAQFPIKIETFEKLFDEKFKPFKDCSIQQFVSFINREFLQSEFNSDVYGLNGLYNPDRGENGEVTLKEDFQGDPSKLATEREQALKNAYPDGGAIQFRKPQIQMILECVPGVVKEGELYKTDDGKSILRVIFHDRSATPLEPQSMVLGAMSKSNFGIIDQASSQAEPDLNTSFGEQAATAQHARRYALVLNLLDKEILEISPPTEGAEGPINGVIRPKVSAGKLREFLRKTAPSCIIGSTGNPVINAQLSSMNDPALASIRIAAATSNKGSAAGNDDQGFPTFIQPTQLNVSMFGMPLMSYAQNVFFDFNTNTNVDNFYVCTGIDHTFGPGEFKTSAKFTQVDGFEKFRSAITDFQSFITKLDETNDEG